MHRFTSVELIVGAVDLRTGSTSSLISIAWDIFDQLGGDNAEDAFKNAWTEYQEARKARAPNQKAGQKITPKPSPSHPWRQSTKARDKAIDRAATK
jgi:hypothetical protein